MQQPQRSKTLLAQMDSLDYLLHNWYRDLITASESFIFSIKNGFMCTSQHLRKFMITWQLIQSAGIKMKECLRATAALKTETTLQKLLERCENTTQHHNLWRNCFWVLALCLYCAHNGADSCIPGFQRLTFENAFVWQLCRPNLNHKTDLILCRVQYWQPA